MLHEHLYFFILVSVYFTLNLNQPNMRRSILGFVLILGIPFLSWAQNLNVTFRVDMNQQSSVSANGVHVAGDFQAAAGFPGDWNPATTALSDADQDGIYEVTVQIPAGSYQYKFINGNAWGQDELAPAACAVGGTNRGLTVSGDTVLPAVCYSQCAPCATGNNFDVTFRVDMSQQTVSANGVHVAGNFQSAAGFPSNWNPGTTALSDADGDGIYEVTLSLPGGTYQYKYVNGNAWGDDESVPGGCATSNNREVTISGDSALFAYCFGTCSNCSAPTYFVQFRVDMNNECDWDSVDVAGDFNNWGGGDMLSPSGTAGVYAVTQQLQAGTYSYKFRKYYNGNITWESINNRSISVVNHTSSDIHCFNSDTVCGAMPTAADITFRVNMTGVTTDSLGVWMVGDFTSPPWQAGALAMSPNANDPDIYEVTVPQICSAEIRFKYVNGDVSNSANEEMLDAADSACTEGNGIGGFNRYHLRSGSAENLYAYWASCDTVAGSPPPPPPVTNDVTLSVDMSNYSGSFTTVNVNGDFNGWCGSCNALTDMGNGNWSVTLPLSSDSIDYKFTLDGWNGQENFAGGEPCTKTKGGFTNRYLRILGDTTVSTVCWESCSTCPVAPPAVQGNITFSVDMSNYSGVFSNVYVSGTFNSWSGDAHQLVDMGNGIYSVTVDSIGPGAIEYKYTLDNWNASETLIAGSSCTVTNGGFTNRTINIDGDSTLATVCWESCVACSAAPATKNVTFTVDVADYTGSFTSIYVNGDFNGWCGTCNPLTDMGNDVWSVTIPLTQDSIEYKFTADGWNDQENLTAGSACTKTTGNFTNRFAELLGDTALAEVCWNSCSDCVGIPTTANVTFRVDMSQYSGSFGTVNLNGNFNNWCGSCNPMTDADGDSIYETTLSVSTAGIEYKFTLDGWTTAESFTQGDPCTVTDTSGQYTNRYLLTIQDTTLEAVCWNSCSACSTAPPPPPPASSNVTLSVDMSNYTGSFTTVNVNGDFNGWCGACNPLTDMGSGIWEVTLPIAADSMDYKFTVDGWNDQENFAGGESCTKTKGGFTNRYLRILGDTAVGTVCWNSCSICSSCDGLIDSVQTINVAQGVYRVHLNGPLPAATSYTVEWKPDTASVYRSKTFTKANLPYMNINVTPWFNNTIVARVGVDDGTSVSYSCEVSFTTPCRPMTLQTAEQNAAKCPGDSALVRVGYAGGRGTKTILWSNGATTKRTYAQQGQTLTVTVTDATGCSLTESITASVLSNTSVAPSNVSTTRSGTVVTVNWTASTFGAGQTLIGYRVQYRLRGTTTWSQTSLTTNTTADVDFAGGTPGNYEFTVIARYNDNGTGTTSARACFTVRGVPTTKRGATSGMDNGSAIAIYPNPAHNQVYVAAASGSEVTLMDLGGRILAMQTVDQAELAFDLSGMANGVYMIQIQSNGEVITERVVKQ